MEAQQNGYILIALVVIIILIAIVIERLSKIITQLEENNRLHRSSVGEASRSDLERATWKCPKCGKLNANTTFQCTGCEYKLV